MLAFLLVLLYSNYVNGLAVGSVDYCDVPLDDNGNACKFLYESNAQIEITNKDKFDRFLTALILSLFICVAKIGLALFGFLLFKGGEF